MSDETKVPRYEAYFTDRHPVVGPVCKSADVAKLEAEVARLNESYSTLQDSHNEACAWITDTEAEAARLTRERDGFRRLLTDVRNLLVEEEDPSHIIEEIDPRWARIENDPEANDGE